MSRDPQKKEEDWNGERREGEMEKECGNREGRGRGRSASACALESCGYGAGNSKGGQEMYGEKGNTLKGWNARLYPKSEHSVHKHPTLSPASSLLEEKFTLSAF
jgi:hypothetical protein